jgi:peptide/nickel transport system substrate-binding protein
MTVRRHRFAQTLARRLAPVVVPITVLTMVMAACSSDDDNSTATSTGAGAASSAVSSASTGASDSVPATTATDTGASVVVGAVLEPTSLDILTVAGAALDQALLDNVYETLLEIDADGNIVPGLATVPEVSADALTYTFTLQPDVTFSDGRALTSADAVWSLQQVVGPDSASPKAASFASVASVDAIDDTSFTVTLSEPDTNFTFNLTERGGAVLEEDAADLGSTAIGTGPFVLKAWNQGTSLEFTRNDSYWGTAPAIAGVTFVYFTEPNAAVNALTTGDVDVLTGVNGELVGPLQDNDDFVVNQGTTNSEFTLGFNNSREALSDQRVRQAIRQAIDHEGILDLSNGFGTLIGGPVPPTDPWYEDLTATAPYDPDAAQQLLADAGYASGLTLDFVVPNIYPTAFAEFIASEVAKVGITLNIQPVEFSVWIEQVYTNADYDLTYVQHVEPRDITNYANPDYYWRYDSPAVQDLIAQALAAPAPAEATELFRRAAAQIAADSPVDWLLLVADLTVAEKSVTGYPTNNTASRFDASRITVGG